ncbi:AzlC family ABC transporter permease [Peptostreptococcaceae bacterium OttesenSCG-928-C18]|nr:AzlC family ABC transporter permease [Peptostreptococcaceae bacterium OttesenSCG-928-C18]
MNENFQIYKLGARRAVPIALGYFAVSFTFGILARKYGLTPFESSLISLTNLTSAGQFAGIEIIRDKGPYIEMVISQLIINSRYLLMSSSLSQKIDYNTSIPKRLLMAFSTTDEIYSLGISYPKKLSPYYIYGAMSVSIPGWTLGTLFGATTGEILPSKIVSTLSIALYIMLITAIIPHTKNNKTIAGIISISMLSSLLFSIIPYLKNISSGVKIIVLSIVITGLAAYFFPLKEQLNE